MASLTRHLRAERFLGGLALGDLLVVVGAAVAVLLARQRDRPVHRAPTAKRFAEVRLVLLLIPTEYVASSYLSE